MKIDLVGLVKRSGVTRRSEVVAPPIIPTKAQETDLRVIYNKVVRAWTKAINEKILPEYKRSRSEAIVDSAEDLEDDITTADAAIARLVATLDAELEDWVVRVEAWHRKKFASSFTSAGVRLDTLLGRGEVQTTLEATLRANSSLIRSLSDQMRNNISGAVFRGLSDNTTATAVAKEIRKATGVARSRAVLIASDQLQKLTGRLDQERQNQVGIKKFKWRHSGKLNFREVHKRRDGKVYSWKSKTAKEDPPGRLIRCGCRAQAVLEL